VPIYETPKHPAFTDWGIKTGLLHEPLRLVDVGVQGGLHPRWRWLGDQFQAWAFDPLPDVIEQLAKANPAPNRIRYFCMGLGNEDGERLFSRDENGYESAFLPLAVEEAQLGRDQAGKLTDNWTRPQIRRLDTLFNAGAFPSIDHLKMDCEGFELEVLKGAKSFLERSGVFAIESESSLKLHPWYQPCHLSCLYQMLGPERFDIYDLHFYRTSRQPLPDGYPHRGRPDTFDFLFLRGFGEDDELSAHPLDRLIKMAIIAELYGLQDVAANIVTRTAARLATRFDPKQALELLRQSWTAMSAS